MGKNICFHGKKNLKSSSFMAQDKHTKEGEKGEKKKVLNPPKILKQQVVQEENQHLKATCHTNRSPTPPFLDESQ
jgi:hypothetical protein